MRYTKRQRGCSRSQERPTHVVDLAQLGIGLPSGLLGSLGLQESFLLKRFDVLASLEDCDLGGFESLSRYGLGLLSAVDLGSSTGQDMLEATPNAASSVGRTPVAECC